MALRDVNKLSSAPAPAAVSPVLAPETHLLPPPQAR